jgi:hypothetical protein
LGAGCTLREGQKEACSGSGRGRLIPKDTRAEISEALTGKKTAEDALNGMVPKVTDIMKRGGYIKS